MPPFSTLTCRLVDLRWLDENFRGPGEPQPVELAPERRLLGDE